MAGVRTNATAGRIELIFKAHDQTEAETMATLVTDTMAASGSGEWEDVTAEISGSGNTSMKIIVPQHLMTNTVMMEFLLLGTVRDKIVPTVVSVTSSTVKDQEPVSGV